MENPDFDVLILGGGLAGASLACALRASRWRVGLIERNPPRVEPGWDARIYAINPANQQFLSACAAWQHLDAERLQGVERMEVFGDRSGRIAFSAYEAGLDALAWIVEGGRLAHELWQTASRQSNVRVLAGGVPHSLQHADDRVILTLENGQAVSARLLVGADGANSWVRGQAGIPVAETTYEDCALVANFRCERGHAGVAYQWFRDDGILAWLPLPGNQISIVWSTSPTTASELVALQGDALCERVAAAGKHMLGELQLLGQPARFPLRLMKVAQPFAERILLIGDAAHTIHPLSGHGINLGFQDASALAKLLCSLPAMCDPGAQSLLKRHARLRREEVSLMQGVTHGLHQLFASQHVPLSRLRNMGMGLVGRVPFFRSVMTRYAAGLI